MLSIKELEDAIDQSIRRLIELNRPVKILNYQVELKDESLTWI